MAESKLYYGDNLDVLRRYVKDESVDLVYLDPPFNSRQDYNVLFAEKDGTRSASQIMVFEDTWEWNQESARTYEQVVEGGVGTCTPQDSQPCRLLQCNRDLTSTILCSPRSTKRACALHPRPIV